MNTTADLAERAAWFHSPQQLGELLARSFKNRDAWLAYADWHETVDNPDSITPEQCRDAIAERMAADYKVIDNITGQLVRAGVTLEHANHLCRGLNLQAGPGGRYAVRPDPYAEPQQEG